MNTFILYFLLANIGLISFYWFFKLLLQRDTFFKEKRFALLLGMVFALTYPMADFSRLFEKNDKVVVYAKTIRTQLPDIHIVQSEIVSPSVVRTAESPTLETSMNVFDWILILYLLIVAGLLFRLFRQLVLLFCWMRKSERFEYRGEWFYKLPKGQSPFSFFNVLFLNPETHSTSDLDEILHHEITHCKQGHSFDVLFSELVCLVFWINPFAWMLKRQIRENLEFIADQNVLNKGFDPKQYQYHLLQLSCQRSDANLANHFNVSQLKKRIVMMNKKKTSWAGLCKYTLTLPLFAALLLTAYAWGQQNEQKVSDLITEVTDDSKLVQKLAESEMPTLAQNAVPKKELDVITNELIIPPKTISIYEFINPYVGYGFSENQYIELIGDSLGYVGYYYGTSDNFDSAREGYAAGFYVLKMDNLEVRKDSISFVLRPTSEDFFLSPIPIGCHTSDAARALGLVKWENSQLFKNNPTKKNSGSVKTASLILKGMMNEDMVFAKR